MRPNRSSLFLGSFVLLYAFCFGLSCILALGGPSEGDLARGGEVRLPMRPEGAGRTFSDGRQSGVAGSETGDAGLTISALCSRCHEGFHGRGEAADGVMAAWMNHPAGLDLALIAIDDPSADIVTCFSCHSTHGSSADEMLRWDHSTALVSQGGLALAGRGCFACHSKGVGF